MNLSIVIPTHNRNRDVSNLIGTLLKQKLDHLQIEVLVIGNLLDHSLKSLVHSFNAESPFPINYHYVGKIGVNAARNLGLQKASASKVYFLDDDVLINNPDHLGHIFQLSIDNPLIAAIGGSYDLGTQAGLLDEVYHSICTSWINEGKQSEESMHHLVGGNTLYNKDVLQEHLLFNEAITFGGSETELNIKLHIKGFKFLFDPTLNIEHSTHLTLQDLSRKALRQGMGRSFHEELVPATFWKTEVHSPKNFLNDLEKNHKVLYALALFYLSLYQFFFHVGYRHGKKQKNGPLSVKAVVVCTFQTFFQIDADQVLFVPNPNALPFHQKHYPALKFNEIHHWMKANVWWKVPFFFFTLIPIYLFKKAPLYLVMKPLYFIWSVLGKIWVGLVKSYWFIRHHLWTVRHYFLKIFNIVYYSILRFLNFLRWKISHYSFMAFNFTIWRIVPLAGAIVICGIQSFFPFNTIGLRVPYNNAFNKIEGLIKKKN